MWGRESHFDLYSNRTGRFYLPSVSFKSSTKHPNVVGSMTFNQARGTVVADSPTAASSSFNEIVSPLGGPARHYNSIWTREEKVSESSAPIGRRDEFQKCISHWYAHNRRDRNAIGRERNTCAGIDSRPLRVHLRACSDRLWPVGQSADRQWVAVTPSSNRSICGTIRTLPCYETVARDGRGGGAAAFRIAVASERKIVALARGARGRNSSS